MQRMAPPPPPKAMVADQSYDIDDPAFEGLSPPTEQAAEGPASKLSHAVPMETIAYDHDHAHRDAQYSQWMAIAAVCISMVAIILPIVALAAAPTSALAAWPGIGSMFGLSNGNGQAQAPDIILNVHQVQVYATRPNHIYEYETGVAESEVFGNETSVTHIMGNARYLWRYSTSVDFHSPDGGWSSITSDRANNVRLYPLSELVVYHGDKLVFRQDSATRDDNLWLVPQQVYDTCNFSGYEAYYLDSDGDEAYNSSFFQFDRRGEVYTNTSAPENANLSYFDLDGWNHFVWEVRDNSHLLPCADDDLYCQLVTADTLYFASMYKWDSSSTSSKCKGIYYADGSWGLKQKVRIIQRTRTSMAVVEGMQDLDPAMVQDLTYSIGIVGRSLVLSQFSEEQRARSEGQSGFTNVRGKYDGDAAYDDGTYSAGQVASIHDHSDAIRVVGIGEIQAVLNGVEFRTRHNDYNLNMPSTTSGDYHAVEEIVPPGVPPQVASAGSASAQVAEMIEWFRAFATQNVTHRDYPAYFRPILCYLEGTWILDDDQLEEPFDSDRHQIDAKSWQQLHDKIRWMSNSGRKSTLENLAHLPSSIRNLLNDTYPIVSNWEYRILCAPLHNDIPTSRFRIEDDLSVQLMGGPETRQELYYSRRARFKLNTNVDKDEPDSEHDWDSGRTTWNYLDYLMEQVPGKDNYLANLTDAFPDGSSAAIHHVTDARLNSGYYSRFYGLTGEDAMGSSKHRRGFSDRYLFAAQTSQQKVSPVEFAFEMQDEAGNDILVPTTSRWSYAIPLEIIYQTPLSTWNPYEIAYVDKSDFDTSRSGACSSASTAFVNWTSNEAYFTPAEMFEGAADSSTADTAASNVCSLLADGSLVQIAASGHWITFPDIAGGVGPVRQRYPIFPIHESGSASFKEVKALQAVSLPDDYDDPVANPDGFFGDSRDLEFGFELNLEGGGHSHVCYLKGSHVSKKWLLDAESDSWCTTSDCYIEAECDTRNGHQHVVRIWRSYDPEDGETWLYHLRDCRFGTLSDEDVYPYPTGWTTFDVDDFAICSDLHNVLDR